MCTWNIYVEKGSVFIWPGGAKRTHINKEKQGGRQAYMGMIKGNVRTCAYPMVSRSEAFKILRVQEGTAGCWLSTTRLIAGCLFPLKRGERRGEKAR